MKTMTNTGVSPRLTLAAETAADLMAPNPVSIHADATVREAIAFLTKRGFSAAPIIDEAGRPIGVLSRSDIILHNHERPDLVSVNPEYYEAEELGAPKTGDWRARANVLDVDGARVRDIMTPVIFSVAPDTPAPKVVEELLARKVHRLFVVGNDGVLVGIIGPFDVLRQLR